MCESDEYDFGVGKMLEEGREGSKRRGDNEGESRLGVGEIYGVRYSCWPIDSDPRGDEHAQYICLSDKIGWASHDN